MSPEASRAVTELPPSRFRNLAEMIFAGGAAEDEDRPVLLGCLPGRELETVRLTLRELRGVLLDLAAQLARRGIAPGDTVALFRSPGTSELPLAVLYVALSVSGVRVFFPMYLDLAAVPEWLAATHARVLLMSSHGGAEARGTAGDDQLVERLVAAAERHGVPVLSFERDLALPERLRAPLASGPGGDRPRPEALIAATSGATECLLLTTSGTSGRPKIVRYAQGALLGSCTSWEQAGLFHPDRLGGRGLSLLLAHSMGLRGLWNALYVRQPLCLITPEWFFEHPERVSVLLQQMQPEHVTGGPATFHTLLEFARVFPRLKEGCLRSLRCLVSSGSAYDAKLARRVRDAFGLTLHNAFGMTETMQVLSTLAPGPYGTSLGSLGNALPGVQLDLDGAGLSDGQRRLRVISPFGFSGYLEEGATDGAAPQSGGPFDTGDLVEVRAGELRYLGRERTDFINDGIGNKISRARVARLYGDLGPEVDAVAFFPLREELGLAAAIFLAREGVAEPIAEPAVLERLRSRVEQQLERIRGEVEALEFQQLAVARFAAVGSRAPRTAKGNLSYHRIARSHGPLVERLIGRYVKHPTVVRIERERYLRSAAVRLTSPRIGEVLRALALDKHYERGVGDRLYYRDGDGEREVIDAVGGYGANLFGHRHPKLVAAVGDFLAGGAVPLLDQGAARPAPGELARRLALLVGEVTGGSYVVRFGSTGAEAVEMALSHACLEREEQIRRIVRDQKRRFGQRAPELVRTAMARLRAMVAAAPPRVLALEGGFHGHTLGARAVLGSAKARAPFASLCGIVPLFLPRDASAADLDALLERERLEVPVVEKVAGEFIERTLAIPLVMAAIAEPIQGEGGAHEIPAALLAGLAGRGFPLILDEIQTGLGRSGELLASAGVRGDYYLFSKALGGGLAKISALLVERRRYVPRFDELYVSTFAGDALSATVACRVLELVVEERVPERCRERGAALRRALESVQRAHPTAVREVRGRGLIQAVELHPGVAGRSFTLRLLAERELLGGLAASYLLHHHGVRVLPTLSAPSTLRLEPSAFVDDAAIEGIRRGLDDLGGRLAAGDAAALCGHLVREEEAIARGEEPEPPPRTISTTVEEPRPGATRVAFVLHFMQPEHELAMVDPSLRRLSPSARRALAERLMALLEMRPVVASARHLFDGRLWLAVILSPIDAATFETLHRMGYHLLETERLQETVDLAATLGCSCVALGGYTSIIARDGTAVLPPPGLKVVSGNTFTAVVGARRLVEACRRGGGGVGEDPRVAVVGATGNIGSALSRQLAGPGGFRRVLLVARQERRLARLMAELYARERSAEASGLEIETATELAALRGCDAIVIATSTAEPLIYPEHLAEDRPVVIADVSVPSAVSAHVRARSNVRVIPLAGTVTIPGAPDLVMGSNTAPGTAYCCAAEGMLVGLEPEATGPLRLTGVIDAASMVVLERLAEKHGLLDALGDGGFRVG